MPDRNADSASNPGRPASLLAHLLRVVTWPHWWEHRLRSALTVVGVALGVATVVGVSDVSRSALASFEETVQTLAGSSELEITSPGGDVDETLVTRVAATPGVAAAAGVVESFLALPDQPDATLYLLGVDFLGSPVWESQIPRRNVEIDDELAFLARPDSLVLTRAFVARAGLAADAPVRVLAPGGSRTLHLRGTLGDVPVARLFDGVIGVMDLPAAQRLLGRDGRVDRIAIQLAPGASADDVRGRLAGLLGPGVELAAPEARGRQCEKLLLSLRTMLATASCPAVIVGAFIVFHTVAVSVYQRRRQFALLNTVGVGRRMLVALCLTETLGLALLGVGLGCVGGWMLARLVSGIVGDTASEIWLRLDVTHQAHSLLGTAVAIAVGLAVSLVAAYLAMRATFRAPTVEALRPAGVESEDPRGVVRPVLLALLLAGSTWLIVLLPAGLGFGPMVTMIIVTQSLGYAAGAVLGAPLVAMAGRLARRAARWVPSLPVRLAAENLPRSPGRGGTTVATVAAALGFAVTLTGLVQSFEVAWLGWIEQHFGADVFVGSGTRFRLLAGPPMDEAVRDGIAATPGVASVEPFRVIKIQLRDQPVFLESISLDDRLAHGGLAMVEGDLREAAPALRDGTGVLLSDNLALKLDLHRGDAVTLPTPAGDRRFRVEGTFVDYLGSLDLGAVAVAHGQLATIWGDRRANLFRIWLAPGAALDEVRKTLLATLGTGYYAITARQFLDGVRTVLDRFFISTWAMEVVAALVGVIGVVNAQLATVLDRSGEIAMIRTIGVSRRDITRAVLLECGALGGLGGLAGLALGTMLGKQFVEVSLRVVTGWRIPFRLPLVPVLTSVAAAALISAVAGYFPAQAAARLDGRSRSVD